MFLGDSPKFSGGFPETLPKELLGAGVAFSQYLSRWRGVERLFRVVDFLEVLPQRIADVRGVLVGEGLQQANLDDPVQGLLNRSLGPPGERVVIRLKNQ